MDFTKGAVQSMWSDPITFRLIVGSDGETKTREVTVEARTAIGDAKFVGEGSNIDAAMQSLIGAVLGSPEGNVRGPHRWPRFDEGVRPQEGYFPMLGRNFTSKHQPNETSRVNQMN